MLNGHAQNTAWSESNRQNGNMFRIPRPLKIGDTIEINGTLQDNPQICLLKLTTGVHSPDQQNIPCWAEFNFSESYYNISGNVNGQTEDHLPTHDPQLLELFPERRFQFYIEVREHDDLVFLDVNVFQARMGSRRLKHRLEDITFLKMDGDITKIEDLKFTYA